MSLTRNNYMTGYSKLEQIGRVQKKQVEKNIEANSELDKIYKAKKKYFKCELRVAKDCLPKQIRSYGVDLKMTYIHRHKRDWYKEKNRGWLLSTYEQTLRGCIPCHMIIEHDSTLTETLFNLLRPVKLAK